MSEPTLLVFSDDWGRHPTSCQHLIRCLLPRVRVVWVNTIGMRRPRLEWYTVVRGFEKLAQWFGPGGSKMSPVDNLAVVSPKLWPGAGRAWERRINVKLFERALLPHMTDNIIAVTTMPIVADLVGRLPVRRWVYYCVDDFATWPGLDHAAIAAQEDLLIDSADAIVTVSDVLTQRVARRGKTAELLTHGVDLSMWRTVAEPRSEAFADRPRPWLLFWGLIDRRMDVELLRQVSGTVLLVGPEDNPDPALRSLEHVVFHSAVSTKNLPGLAAAADVLVLPYVDAPVTRAIQPLKLKEYLATGRPVVARDLPAVREWADCLDLADTSEKFAHAVARRANGICPPEQAAGRTRLVAESWDAKADRFYRILRGD
ncbi:MAG: glycosyltransferase [Gemmataceae bacterium]|nr:glycosyltransferase [Gemmataceae bacterium]